jgi:hypothetical protein
MRACGQRLLRELTAMVRRCALVGDRVVVCYVNAMHPWHPSAAANRTLADLCGLLRSFAWAYGIVAGADALALLAWFSAAGAPPSSRSRQYFQD